MFDSLTRGTFAIVLGGLDPKVLKQKNLRMASSMLGKLMAPMTMSNFSPETPETSRTNLEGLHVLELGAA